MPLSLLVMVRHGFLKDEEFTRGRLQPYVGVGPSLFINNVSGSIRFQESNDTSTDVGLDFRLGTAFLIETNWSAFIEYRFTHVSPTWGPRNGPPTPPALVASRETRDAPR